MIGHVYIEGQIGSSHKEDGTIDVRGVELVDVVSQVHKNKEAEKIFCHITSPGGSVDVGRKISEYLKSLPNIYTVADGQCASIATEIHLSVPVERRQIAQGTQYLIHQPMFSLQRGIALNTDELALMSAEIGKTQGEMVSMYSKATGMDKTALEQLMKQETALTAEQCKQFGFVSEIITPTMQAVALLTPTKKENGMSEVKEEITGIKSMLKTIGEKIAAMGEDKPETKEGKSIALNIEKVALDLTTEDGVDVVVTDPEGDANIDVPMIGDSIAMADGEAVEDGTYKFPQGQLVVVGGVITDVLAAEDEVEETEEVASLKTENETLKSENEEIKVALEDLKKDVQAMAKLQSTYKPKAEKVAFKKKEVEPSKEQSGIKQALKDKQAK